MKVYVNNFNLQIFIFLPMSEYVLTAINGIHLDQRATEKEINRALSKKRITLLGEFGA